MKTSPPPPACRAAFTWIELLVVIAIFAILAATLLPALSLSVFAESSQTNASAAVECVPMERMQQVYQEVKTFFKYGIVIRGETNQLVDCPSIFRQQDQWYMVYIGKLRTLGHSFVMFYNGKCATGERIDMAVSDDLIQWHRFGKEPVVANGNEEKHGVSGDPQIVRMGDLWVMFYFGAFWQPGTFDTFACSTDLVHWTKWAGPASGRIFGALGQGLAHKPWVIKHDGVVYHFYCAGGNQGRVIALATSKEFPH